MNRFSDSLYSAVYPRLPVMVQNWACTIGGWARFRRRFNRHFHRTLGEWEKTADWPAEDVSNMQTSHSPFLSDPVGLAVLLDRIARA